MLAYCARQHEQAAHKIAQTHAIPGAAGDENSEHKRRSNAADQGPQCIKNGDSKRAYLEGKNLAHRQISGTGRGGCDKKNQSEANAHATSAQGSMGKGVYGAEEEEPGNAIGRGDHRLAPDLVEKATEQHRAEEAANRKGQQVDRQVVITHVKELLHDQTIGKEDSIEEERLTDHQGQRKKRALAVVAHHVAKNLFERRVVAHDDFEFCPFGRRQTARVPLRHLVLNIADHFVRLLFVAPKHQPAWTLRNIKAEDQHCSPQAAANPECVAPASRGGDTVTMEQEQGCYRPQRGAHPEGPVDGQIYGAANLAGNELVNRRVDRGVFSANPAAGEETENGEAQEVPGKSTRDGGD